MPGTLAVVLWDGRAYFPPVADIFRLRGFQGLLLLLLAAIALQVGGAVSQGAPDYGAKVHGAAFRADTPEAVLLPIRLDRATVDTPDPGPSFTDDLTRTGPKKDLLPFCCGHSLPDQAPAHVLLDGAHRLASLPRAPPVS